jgi:hypothetical protein
MTSVLLDTFERIAPLEMKVSARIGAIRPVIGAEPGGDA